METVLDSQGDDVNDKDYRAGVDDKRLLIIESEFASVLARGKREGNPLAQTMRDAWDGTRLSTMVRKQNRLIATDHHIVMVGHITADELRAKLADSDLAGGSMNRLLTICSKRSKRLPDGGGAPETVIDDLADTLSRRVEHAQAFGRIERDDNARTLWREAYEGLTPDVVVEGHYAQVVARAVPQLLRLSLTYALLDEQPNPPSIRAEHLRAALALWDYAQSSAWYVFGDIAANVDLARLCAAVDNAQGASLTRTQLSGVFSGNKSANALAELIRQAVASGNYVMSTHTEQPGRPVQRLTSAAGRDELDELDEVTPHRRDHSSSSSSNSLASDRDDRPISPIQPRPLCLMCERPGDRPGGGLCQSCYDHQAAAS